MNTNGFKSFLDARKELASEGYGEGFSSPGRPFLFVKKGSRLAVCEVGGVWNIVAYPEPSCVSPGNLVKEGGYAS